MADDRTPNGNGLGRAPDTELDEAPSVLGAAPTLPAERKRRKRRAERRRRRRVAERSKQVETAPPTSPARLAGDDGDWSGEVQVFEPKTSAMPALRPYARSLWDRRQFMVEMAKADLRGRRSSTVFGSVWGILDPLFQAGIYYLLFTIIREGARPVDFLHVLIGGIFLFQLALIALNEAGQSIKGGKGLLLNSSFPRAMLPLTTLCKGVLKFLPTVGVYAMFHLLLGAPIGRGLLLLPVLFVLQLVLMAGIALTVSTAVVFFPDAGNAIQYVGRILFFTTPVIYPLDVIPPGIRAVLSWQPLFALFASYQEILDGGVPDVSLMLQVLAWAIGFLFVGCQLFLRHEREFALRV